MSKRKKIIIAVTAVIAILAIIAPIYFYVKDFHMFKRSVDPADWGTFGDYFGGILNPIISLLTLIVTIIIAINLSGIEKRNHEETVHSPVKPFFVIGDGYFYSSDISRNGLTVNKDYYDYNPPQKPADEWEYRDRNLFLKIFNKGLGVATDVRANFEIDLNELIKILPFDEQRIKIEVSEVRIDEDKRKFIALSIDAQTHFNYKIFFSKILAKESVGLGVVDKENEIHATIPSQMMSAFQLVNLIRRLGGNDLVFPTLYATFDYKNIFGKSMQSKFRIGLLHVHDYATYSVFRLAQEQI